MSICVQALNGRADLSIDVLEVRRNQTMDETKPLLYFNKIKDNKDY